MTLILYLTSILFFILGWLYYSSPKRAERIHSFFTENFFNERLIVLKRKKVAFLFLLIGVFFSMAAFAIAIERERKAENEDLFKNIKKDVYSDAAFFYSEILKKTPDNAAILAKYAFALENIGDKTAAAVVIRKLDKLNNAAAQTEQNK